MVRAGGPVAEAATAAGLDPAALAAIGIDLDAVRRHAYAVFGPGALDHAGAGRRAGRRGHIPFTKEAKTVLEVALREAITLRHREIGSVHLMLALIRMTDSAAHRLLVTSGADPATVRTEVLARRSDAA